MIKPQFATKHEHNAVVILSFDEYKKITQPKTNLVTFLRNFPLTEIEFDVLRNKELPRDIEL